MTLGERVVWEVGRWLSISAYHRSPGIALYGGTQVEDLLYYTLLLYYIYFNFIWRHPTVQPEIENL